ncbi:MAG: hypothetical protein KDA86_06340 [Planctomycetaceae bacterium]|nr:hypothetical protein [Planctomycetaceae bacterium]
MKLIPTAYRQKLTKGRSYPLGTEMISTALSSVRIFDQLMLSFHRQPEDSFSETVMFQASRVKVKHHGGEDLSRFYGVLAIRSPVESGSIGVDVGLTSQWAIHVSSVWSDARSRVRDALQTFALPRVRDWLTIDRPPHWFGTCHTFHVGVDTDVTELCLTEMSETRRDWFEIIVISADE